MLLRSGDFLKICSAPQHHLHPNSRILSEGQILIFKRVARQNPAVLQPLEMVCSGSKHPLSSVSGRRRYNTLDFPQENRVPTGCFHPYWKPRSQGTCSPFTIPARLCICTHKQRKWFCEHRSMNAKNPTVDPPKRRGKTMGFSLCRIHWSERNSCVTHQRTRWSKRTNACKRELSSLFRHSAFSSSGTP